MLYYILEVSICWLCFYGFYYCFLSRETFFSINRWYLMGTVLIGVCLPLISWEALFAISKTELPTVIQPIVVGLDQAEIIVIKDATTNNWNWLKSLYAICMIGSIWMSIQLLRGLWAIKSLIKSGNPLRNRLFTWIFHQRVTTPFSFFQYLFCPNEHQFSQEERHKVQTHELAHIQGYHSIDVLIMEILTILFWFNPLIYLYKKSLHLHTNTSQTRQF